MWNIGSRLTTKLTKNYSAHGNKVLNGIINVETKRELG